MKALVIDPDRNARSVVKRLLSHVNVDVVEADNGLVALSVLEQSDPVFVVIEVEMPILSGYDCLAAIRQSPVRPDIPVVCITATGTRDAVMRMVSLGVSDFLLKPINPAEVLPRIKNLLVRVSQWRQRTDSKNVNALLIVDNDPNFLAFAKPLLENSFEVFDAPASTAAAISFRDAVPKPTVVCIAEGLPLMNEDLLVEVIRKMAIESGNNPPQFFLLSKGTAIPEEKAARYAGIVRKSFVPQGFLDEFRRVVLREQSLYEKLSHLVREGLRSEVVTATQQTIGVMTGSEITELPDGDTTVVPSGVSAESKLLDTESGTSMTTVISSGRSEVERMGSQIVRREITFEDGASEVLRELANTIAGRMRACLLSRGFDLKMALPEIRAAGEAEVIPETGFDLEAKFKCSTGEVFRVTLQVIAGAGGEVAAATLGGTDEVAEVAEAAPAEPTQSADDALF